MWIQLKGQGRNRKIKSNALQPAYTRGTEWTKKASFVGGDRIIFCRSIMEGGQNQDILLKSFMKRIWYWQQCLTVRNSILQFDFDKSYWIFGWISHFLQANNGIAFVCWQSTTTHPLIEPTIPGFAAIILDNWDFSQIRIPSPFCHEHGLQMNCW